MNEIQGILANHPEGLSPGEMEKSTGFSRSTLNRRLREELTNGAIIQQGNGASTRYFSADPLAAIRSYLETPYTQRKFAPYRENQLAIEPGIAQDKLTTLSQANYQPLDKRHLSQFLVDFSCASSALEGSSYSLLDTQSLIEYGERSKDKPLKDAFLVLNHKEAFEYLYDHPQLDSIFKVHALLTNDHDLPELTESEHFLSKQDRGVPREYSDVNINASAYLPPFRPGAGYIVKMLDLILDRATQIKDPIQSSFYLFTRLPYLQPFRDGNKRTSRAMCNVPLMQAGLPPISFVDFEKKDYITSTLAFYELGDTRLAGKCFVDAYRKSQERLIDVRERSAIVTHGHYSGKILEIKNGLVRQKTGRGEESVIHELKRLSGSVVEGSIVDINYRNGIAFAFESGKSLGVER